MDNPTEDEHNAVDDDVTNIFIDDLPVLLGELPYSFDFGTVLVEVSCIDVSAELIVLGTTCGAIFYVDYKTGAVSRPLRTTSEEYVTCIRCTNGNIAAGHLSGMLAILQVPLPGRKVQQRLERDRHRGAPIRCVEWSTEGNKLFSADHSGLIILTHVDFEQKVFEHSFVHCGSSPIQSINYRSAEMAVCFSSGMCCVVSISTTDFTEVSWSNSERSRRRAVCVFWLGALESRRLCVLFEDTWLFVYELNHWTEPVKRYNIRALDKGGSQISLLNSQLLKDDTQTPVNSNSKHLPKILISRHEEDGKCVYTLDTGQVTLFQIDLELNVQILMRLELRPLTSKIFDVSSVNDSLFAVVGPRRIVWLGQENAPEQFRKQGNTKSSALGAFSVFMDSTTSLLERVAVPKDSRALKNFSTAIEGMTSRGLDSLDSISSKLTPTIETLVGSIQNHVDNSTYGAQEGQIIDEVFNDLPDDAIEADVEEGGDTPRAVVRSENVPRNKPQTRRQRILESQKSGSTSSTSSFVDTPAEPEELERRLQEARNIFSHYGGQSGSSPERRGVPIPACEKSLPNSPLASSSAICKSPPTLLDVSHGTAAEREPECSLGNNESDSDADVEVQESLLKTVLQSHAQNLEEMIGIPSDDSPVPESLQKTRIEKTQKAVVVNDMVDIWRQIGIPSDDSPVPESLQKTRIEKTQKAVVVNDMIGIPSDDSPVPESLQKTRIEKTQKAVVVNDMVDIWRQTVLPFTPSSLCTNQTHLIMCHRKRNPKWCFLHELGTKKTNWQQAGFPAQQLETNETGDLVWRLHKSTAYTTPELALSCKWTEAASCDSGIVNISLTGKDAWYITGRAVNLQMELPEQGILHAMECEWPLRSISASSKAVWAIRADRGSLVVRVGMNRCRMGYDWVDVPLESCARVVAVCVRDSVGFCLDEEGRLWMTRGVDEHHPYGNGDEFLRVCTPLDRSSTKGIPSPSEWRLSVCDSGLFLSVGRTLYSAKVAVSGHRFTSVVSEKVSVYDNFTMISAGALCDENEDGIFACRPNSEVFVYRTPKKSFITYTLPICNGQLTTIIRLCSVAGRLILLDSCGAVFERNVSGQSILPSDGAWRRIDTGGVFVQSVAVSESAMWVVTADNLIMVRTETESEQNWTKVDCPTKDEKSPVEEIRCSRDGRYIWILSVTGKRCWARSGVSASQPTGTKWTEASSDPPIIDLAVGCNVVWGLAADGVLYRLRGLAAGNPAGNYWRALPVKLRSISVDHSNCLWGVGEDSKLVRHVTDVHNFTSSHADDRLSSNSYEFI